MPLRCMTPEIDQHKMDLIREKGLTRYYLMRCVPNERCVNKIVDYVKPELTNDHKRFLASSVNVHCVRRFKWFGCINVIGFNHDGSQLAVGERVDGFIKIWNLQTGKCNKVLNVGRRPVDFLAFSHNGKHLATTDEYVQVWDLQTGKHVITLNKKAAVPVFSPDDNQLACAELSSTATDGYNPSVNLWDLQTGECRVIFNGGVYDENSIVFSSDGAFLVVGFSSGIIKVLNLQTGEQNELEGHFDTILSIVFSKDNQQLISTAADGVIKLWDVKDRICINSIQRFDVLLYPVILHRDGKQVVGSDGSNVITLLDLQSGAHYSWRGHKYYTACMKFSPDENYLASGSRSVRIWDIQKATNLFARLNNNDFTFDEHILVTKYADKQQATKSQKEKLIDMGFKLNDSSLCSIQ